MSTQPKKHHYVPKFILKNFSRSEPVYVFNKSNEKSYLSNIKNVFSENNFNNINNNIELENIYSKIESQAAPIIQAILKHKSIQWLDLNAKSCIKLFISVQYLRTHTQRNNIKSMLESILQKLLDSLEENEAVSISAEIKKLWKKIRVKKFQI